MDDDFPQHHEQQRYHSPRNIVSLQSQSSIETLNRGGHLAPLEIEFSNLRTNLSLRKTRLCQRRGILEPTIGLFVAASQHQHIAEAFHDLVSLGVRGCPAKGDLVLLFGYVQCVLRSSLLGRFGRKRKRRPRLVPRIKVVSDIRNSIRELSQQISGGCQMI